MVEVTLSNGTKVNVVMFKARIPGEIIIPDYQLSQSDTILERLDADGNPIVSEGTQTSND